MSAIALRSVPSPTSILMNQVRLLAAQQKWELLAIGLITAVYHLGTVDPVEAGFARPFIEGALGNAGSLIFLVVCSYWAIRVWDGLRPGGDRSSFLSYPAGRSSHHLLRVAAGALLLVAVVSLSWMVGAVISEIAAPGRSWLTSPDMGGGAWPISLFAILNAYLYGSILAQLSRQPGLWFVFSLLASMLITGILLPLLDYVLLNKLILTVLFPPHGAFAGFGFPAFDIETETLISLPSLVAVLMWTAIFSVLLYLSSRIHREN
ncbi:hypothetical protein ACFL6R_06585 [Gemmatimonadota bacterium]